MAQEDRTYERLKRRGQRRRPPCASTRRFTLAEHQHLVNADAQGNLREWWSPTVNQEFDKRASCVVQQFEGYTVLGTDGFGRSDFRKKLREHFEVNRHYVVVAALKALADEGQLPATKVAEAIKKYGLNTEKINPLFA